MSNASIAAERRFASLERVKGLVEARKETLALFSALAAKRPFRPEPDVQELLQEFCEALVDYTASGHFQLYRKFEEGQERRANVRAVADEVYPRIAESTARILAFNDKYDCEDHCEDMASLADDLSVLGETLADRINLEDQILSALAAPQD